MLFIMFINNKYIIIFSTICFELMKYYHIFVL
nr:MAG TPA: hypothetical protein [Caudoviricetes sp.]